MAIVSHANNALQNLIVRLVEGKIINIVQLVLKNIY